MTDAVTRAVAVALEGTAKTFAVAPSRCCRATMAVKIIDRLGEDVLITVHPED